MSNQGFDDPFNQFDDLDNLDGDTSDLDTAFDDRDQGSFVQEEGFPDEFDTPDEDPQVVMPSQTAPSAPQGPTGEQKSFIKTPIGMATVGLGTLGVLIAGGVAVTSMGSGEEVAVISAPVIDMGQPVQQVAEPNFSDVVAPPAIQAPAVAAPIPVQVAQPVFEPSVPTITDLALKPSAPASDEFLELLKAQHEDIKSLKKMVMQITRESAATQQILQANEKRQAALIEEVKALAKKIETGVKLQQVQPVVADTKPASATTSTPAVVAPAENSFAAGRQRIYDFQVIESSASGEMTIIKKVSNGRVFTVFKGEVLNIGGQRLTVQALADKGTVVLVGDKLFIDKTLAPKPVQAKASAPVRKSVAAAKPTTRDAKGFTLNAVYDSDNSFGVVDDKGNFKSYRIGETVPELGGGKVQGLDARGNLKVGDFVIKSLY